MSAHEPQDFELKAFGYFKELMDCKDSDRQLFLDGFKSELDEMKAYLEANGCSEREAFEAVFCEPQQSEKSVNIIPAAPLPELPELQTYEQLKAQQPPDFLKADEWFNIDVSKDYLDFTKPYEKPHKTLSMNGIAFAPLKGIHALTGQSGHGKTMLFTQFMAAILSGEFVGLRYELSDIIPKPSVLYVDTEMEEENTIAVKNRVCELINRNPQQSYDDFKILMLRETEEAIDRWRKTLKAIFEVKPTVVFIDGLLDLVNDFNKNDECQRLIYRCMQVASHYGISVWCLVHQNPGNTTKLVGHLGSMLERKVTDVFCCVKETDDRTGEVTFTVKQTKARGRDVPAWKFRVLPVGSYGRPEQIISKSVDDEIPIEDIEAWLKADKDNFEQPLTLETVKDIFRQRGHIKASDLLQRTVERARNKRLIIPQDKTEYERGQKHPRYYINL